MINPPNIEVKLCTSGGWEAIYTRDRRYRGYGNNPTEAVGHLVITYPMLSGFNTIHYADDAATRTHVAQSGLDLCISKSPVRWQDL